MPSQASSASGFRKHATFSPASKKLLGFRLRSPLRGTMPAQPSNGFFHPLPFANNPLEAEDSKKKGDRLLFYYERKI
jgi:hypothetical protein